MPVLDLATSENWFGFRPGMNRAEALEQLAKLQLEESESGDDYLTVGLGNTELELWFETKGAKRLRQLGVDGDVVWNDQAITGVRLDDALRALEPFERAPQWDINDATNDPFPVGVAGPPVPASGERLLAESTVWLPDKGIGLVVYEAVVSAVVWRQRDHLPDRFLGPVTDDQRQLSKRPDLADYLREKRLARPVAGVKRDPLVAFRVLLVVVCLVLLALVAGAGFREWLRWNNAPVLNGKFVAMDEVPRKKFFDQGPDFLRRHMPDDLRLRRELYRVDFLDPAGTPRSVLLEAADFYIAPHDPGEDVQLAFIAGNPPEAKGLSRARDAAFLRYFPRAIAVALLYWVGRMSLALLPKLPGVMEKLTAGRSPANDPDHPEVR
jgi:hypothetical protein